MQFITMQTEKQMYVLMYAWFYHTM